MKEKKGLSIRTKLIVITVPIVLVMVVSFFFLSRSVVLRTSQEELQAVSQGYAGEVSSWVNRILGELQVYQDTIEEGNFADDAAILKYMEHSVQKNEAYPVGLYMGDDSGVYLDGSGWVPGDDWVLTERDWYVDGKDNDVLAFGEPYYDSMTGDVCVSASVRVDYDGAVRVLATDIYLDFVSELVADIEEQGKVKGFLVTGGTQTIIAHPQTEMMAVALGAEEIDSLYGEVAGHLQDGKEGLVSVSGDDAKYLACINPVENTDWYLVTYVAEKEVLSELYSMELYMVLIATVATILLVMATLGIMNRVVKPVSKATQVMNRIAEGDFTQNMEVKGNDEIAQMSGNMQRFIVQMRSTISEIRNTADWLNCQAAANDQMSESLMDSSRKQTAEMDMLGKMVEQLSKDAQMVTAKMDSLVEWIKMADAEGAGASVLMRESVEMSQNGKRDMEQINTGMQNINDSITALDAQISKVGDTTAQIGDMVNLIQDIAEETNLLSLNASIEAARAGEAGRGFAVVAEQIGKLASNSSVAADDISRLTEEIRQTVGEAITHMDASVKEVKSNAAMVTEASTTFEELYVKVEETSRRVGQMIELVDKIDGIAVQMEEITGSQMQATEAIVQSARGLEQHTQNLSVSSNTVADSAEELKKEAVVLSEKMDKFRL